MSLGKLLASGRSLIGGAPGEGRYNISNANRLPKFGSVKNPFAPATTSEARESGSGTGVSPVRCEEQTRADIGMQTEALAGRDGSLDRRDACPTTTQPDCETVEARIAEFVKHSEEMARASHLGAPAPLPAELSGKLPAGVPALPGRGLLQTCRLKAGAAWTFILRTGPLARVVWEKLKFISIKLAGLFRRREQPEPKPLFPRFGKSVVQAELSLDSIKVVRNNLEESDLEIVTAETRTGTQVAPTTPVAQPKRGPVPAALKKMTGVIAKC